MTIQTAVASTIPLRQIKVQDDFWSSYISLVRETVIPYQWEALNDRIADAEPSYAIRNFKIAAGEEQGEFGGMVFQDSDVAKWLEAVAYSLTNDPDAELERLADETIDLIGRAQQPDGYLNTYYIVKEPGNRWTNLLDCHELYCAGHMIEAAVAYYEATGKQKLLDIVCRFVDLIDRVFGPEEGKLHGYCGHQEIELALVKLYEVTGEERYLQLSLYFINERGNEPHYFLNEWKQRGKISHWTGQVSGEPDFRYNQSHLPVREQEVAVGHAVRAVYMYTAMADLAKKAGDATLLDACRKLWNNIVSKQMYITGSIGSTAVGEAFTFDYHLPNDYVYAETCASIGLIFFANRMLRIEPRGEYADVMERALYNNVIGSMSLDGKHYFYVNPLEVWPHACHQVDVLKHVKTERQRWFGCSCCPPNVARLISSLGQYIYTIQDRTIYTHLFIGNETMVKLGDTSIRLLQQTEYPWNGKVTMEVNPEQEVTFALALRIPGWCSQLPKLIVNGVVEEYEEVENGYVHIARAWRAGDRVEWILPMDVRFTQANPLLRADAGKVAIERGPLVYCLEQVDNGEVLSAISISPTAGLQESNAADLPERVVVLEGEGWKDPVDTQSNVLYYTARDAAERITFTAVPYYLWGNRGYGEMSVWMRARYY